MGAPEFWCPGTRTLVPHMFLTDNYQYSPSTKKVNESSIHPSDEPQTKKPEFSHENPLETENLAFFGTRATDGSCIGVVYNIGLKTVYGRISGLTSSF